jgi:hypothetical protein
VSSLKLLSAEFIIIRRSNNNGERKI